MLAFAVALAVGTIVLVLGVLVCQYLIWKKLWQLHEGSRLSTVLTLEPASVVVDWVQFEPKKPVLLEKAIRVLRENKNPQPETRAFCVMEHSGLNAFFAPQTKMDLREALTRLIANEDIAGAEELLKVVVGQI